VTKLDHSCKRKGAFDMKKILISSLGVVAALGVSASVVHATQTQSQEFSQSSSQKVNFECQGNPCVVNFENTANQSGKQSQTQDTGYVNPEVRYVEPTQYVRPAKKFKTSKARPTKRVVNSAWVYNVRDAEPTNATVRLSWPMRGGTCHVRYGETSANSYPYSTSTGCDNGGITIGGLVPGRSYRFQVASEGANWSSPVTVVAR
jgi:hypothetical protein